MIAGIRYFFAALALLWLLFVFGPGLVVGAALCFANVVHGAAVVCLVVLGAVFAAIYLDDYEHDVSDR